MAEKKFDAITKEVKRLKDELEDLRFLKNAADMIKSFRKELVTENCD